VLDHGATVHLAGDLPDAAVPHLRSPSARAERGCPVRGQSLYGGLLSELIAAKLHLFSPGADAGPAILSSLVEGRLGLAVSQTGPFRHQNET
jgi:hypothetical protein